MTRNVLIEICRVTGSDYATLFIRLADEKRTPLLKLRILASELQTNLKPANTHSLNSLTDGEIVT